MTIVGMLATVGTSQNCQKKRRSGSQNCDEQFSFKNKKTKKLAKVGGAKFIFKKEICDRKYLFAQNFRSNKEKKRLLLLVNFVLLETLRFALTEISNPESFPATASSSSSSSS